MGGGRRSGGRGERWDTEELRVRTVGKGAGGAVRERGKTEKVKRKLRAR